MNDLAVLARRERISDELAPLSCASEPCPDEKRAIRPVPNARKKSVVDRSFTAESETVGHLIGSHARAFTAAAEWWGSNPRLVSPSGSQD